GAPVARVLPPGLPPLPVVDLTGLPAARRDAEATRLRRREAAHPFDLRRGPLLRATLLAVGDGAWLLLFTLHHIVFDGWSAAVLVRELSAVYGAWSQGLPSPLAPLALQSADHALWQRRELRGEALEGELAFWRRHLAG